MSAEARDREQLSQSKEILRDFLTKHDETVRAEVAKYDGLHHELRFKQDFPEVFEDQIRDWERLVDQVEPQYIRGFCAYIVSPERDLLVVGNSPRQTGTELLRNIPELQDALQEGKVFASSGYIFSIPELSLNVATVERVFVVMSHTANFSNPFTKRLSGIVDFLEEKGYIAMAIEEKELKIF